LIPFGAAYTHELFSHIIVWLSGFTIVRTRQIATEEALLPTMSPDRTPTLFMYFGLSLSGCE